MPSQETEACVARVLMALAEGERTSEVSRQVLSDNIDFDPYQIFKFLDTEGKNRIDAVNIINFLRTKGTYPSQSEAELLILFYDQDADGCLSYTEFISLVQSEKVLRKSNPLSTRLSFNIEYSLSKLLSKEIEISRNILSLLNSLHLRYDFNVHDIFHQMKSWNSISLESLKSFLNRNGVNILDAEARAIMKRLDLNRDGQIDICEFHAFIGYPNCGRYCPCKKTCSCFCVGVTPCYHPLCLSPLHKSLCCSPCRHHSRSRSISSPRETKLKDSNAFDISQSSTYFQSSWLKDEMRTQSPEVRKVSPNLSLRLSPQRKFSPRRTSPMRRSPMRNSGEINTSNISTIKVSNDQYEKNQFIDYLRKVMDAESRIEKAKIDLAMRSDFNVEDAFRIFELDGRGYITEEDLKYGLNQLELYPNNSEVRLLMKRFDNLKEGVLNFADFFDMVTPFEGQYRNMVESRPPNSLYDCKCSNIFMMSTKIYLKNLLRLIIDTENSLNMSKKGYTNMRYKLNDIYKGIDLYGYGYFGNSDLTSYLKANYAFSTTHQADLLFIRLDRNRNGKVEYSEIDDELTPVY